MKCAYKREINKKKLEQINQQEKDAITYMQCLLFKWLREDQQWGIKKIQKFIDETLVFINDKFFAYQAEDEKEYDPRTVAFILQSFKNSIESVGVDVKDIEDRYAPPKLTRLSNTTQKMRREKLMDRYKALRPYMYGYMIVLNVNYGFGKTRLERMYEAVWSEYRQTWNKYLWCTSDGDRQCYFGIQAVIKEVKNMGIDPKGSSTYVDDDGTVYQVESVEVDLNEPTQS